MFLGSIVFEVKRPPRIGVAFYFSWIPCPGMIGVDLKGCRGQEHAPYRALAITNSISRAICAFRSS